MKISDFILLNIEEKNSILLHIGILVGKRKSSDCFIFLFQVENFYVEVYCDLTDKSIQEYKIFQNTNQLHPYLESVSIDGLL